jgi:hypothetical protein
MQPIQRLQHGAVSPTGIFAPFANFAALRSMHLAQAADIYTT